jgi:uncharacterized RDD family membrane protein YckC
MSQLSINTTQNVTISFTAASVGERIGAYAIDMLIKISYGIIIVYGVFYYLNFGNVLSQMDNWSRMATIALFYLPVAVYSLVLELLYEGQTFGKKLLKIRVVKLDGYQASFGDHLIRWLFRVIDISISSGIIGLIAMVVNKNTQRLGDISAGTAVITLKSKISIDSTILEEIEEVYQPKFPLVIKLSDNDVRIIKETYNAAAKTADFVVLNKLTAKIEEVTGIKNDMGNTREFIQTILKDYNYYTQNM